MGLLPNKEVIVWILLAVMATAAVVALGGLIGVTMHACNIIERAFMTTVRALL